MAVYVSIVKEQEVEEGFVYRYTAADGTIGLLKFNKADGTSHPLKVASGDVEKRSYMLAARKLLRHFQAGEFPQETCWAS